MLSTIIIVIAFLLLGYALRRNFRRFWHVLRTGDEHPDWERKLWKFPPREKETDTSSISE